jgi:hypothetical protein
VFASGVLTQTEASYAASEYGAAKAMLVVQRLYSRDRSSPRGL